MAHKQIINSSELWGYIEASQFLPEYEHVDQLPLSIQGHRQLNGLLDETIAPMRKHLDGSQYIYVSKIKPVKPRIGNVLYEVDVYGSMIMVDTNYDTSD